MAARYKHYPRNFQKEVLNGDMLIPELERRGRLVAEAARASTPEGDGRDGHIRDHYRVETFKSGGVNRDRVETKVFNDHPRSAHYELGYVTKSGRSVKAANKLSGALWAARS